MSAVIKLCIIQEYIVERNLPTDLKGRSFPDCEMFALFCVKFVQAFSVRPVHCYNFTSFFARRKFVDVQLILYLMLGDFWGVFSQDVQIPGVNSLGGNKFCTATPVFVGS